jgi:hypothetical protein
MPDPNAIGPDGRTFDEITGTEYISEEEREFYLNQIGMTVGDENEPVPLERATPESDRLPPPPPPVAGIPREPVPDQNAVGPEGRTFRQITGTDYKSDAEREFYLNQILFLIRQSQAITWKSVLTIQWTATRESISHPLVLVFQSLPVKTVGLSSQDVRTEGYTRIFTDQLVKAWGMW